jgi:hypothetical protein
MDPFARRLHQMATGSIDDLDGEIQRMADAQQQIAAADQFERRRIARLYFDTFETAAGREVLSMLRAQTYARPPTQAELDERDPMAFALAQARRQGAANVIHMIESALALARGEEPDDE